MRFYNREGKFHIEGIGKGLATSILMDLDPQNMLHGTIKQIWDWKLWV